MTLTLTRNDFAHMTRQRMLQDGRWQTVCACGWLSAPAAHPDLWVCPRRQTGQSAPASASSHSHDQTLDAYPVTPESIAAAKAHRDAERRELERMVPGIRILEDGTIIYPSTHPTIQ